MNKKIALSLLLSSFLFANNIDTENPLDLYPKTTGNEFFKTYSIKNINQNKTTLNDAVNKISSELFEGIDKKTSLDNLKIGITSLVNLHNIKETTHFGRIISESLFNELHKKGLSLIDFRGQTNISINDTGEFFLSRNIKDLNPKVTVNYILVGTYSVIEEGILINTRIIDNKTGKLLTSSRIIYNTNDCRLFKSCQPEKPKIVEVGNVINKKPKFKERTIRIITEN